MFMLSIAALLSKEALLYVGTSVRNGIQHYANARKRTHISVTCAVFMVEAIAIFSVHEPLAHLFLSGGVTSWEALVIKIGETVEEAL